MSDGIKYKPMKPNAQRRKGKAQPVSAQPSSESRIGAGIAGSASRGRIATLMEDDVLDEGHVDPARAEVPAISGLHHFGAEDRKLAMTPLGKTQELEVSSRDRVLTPSVSNELIEENFVDFQKSVRDLPTADIEVVPAAKHARSSEDQIATPVAEEQDVISQQHFWTNMWQLCSWSRPASIR